MRVPPDHIRAALLVALLATGAAAADDKQAAEEPAVLDTVTILGTSDQQANIGGSAYFIGPDTLKKFRYADVLRILRTAPGVYIQEEDGFGLRPNIGLRGSGLDRSARIALLEDGVLISPAPYSAPAAYYFPSTRRMNGIEVLKGPSSINVGSRTTGGAVNLLSTPIPNGRHGAIDTLAGDNGLFDTHAWYGGSTEHFGWMMETVQQFNDGFKDLDANTVNTDTGFETNDYLAKFRINSGAGSTYQHGVELKLGYTDHVSDETYLGLTDEDFRATPFRRYAGSQRDRLVSDHRQHQATYSLAPVDGRWDLSVTGYYNDFSRNWYKADSVLGIGISEVLDDPIMYATELDYLRGADSPDDAIVLRNNNRNYYSRGLQGALQFGFAAGTADIDITTGFRFHQDEEDRFQDEDGYRVEDGDLVITSDGPPGSQSNRVSQAEVWSLFASADIIMDRLTVTPGLRFEDIRLTRRDYSTSDPARSMGPVTVRENQIDELIPGIAGVYRIGNKWRLLAGIHKGFNPPAPGSESEAEESTNFEFGARFQSGRVHSEIVWFHNEYDNLIGTVTASTGGGGMIGDQFDGGEARINGLEFSFGTSLIDLRGSGIDVPLDLSYTFTNEARFLTSFASDFDPWGDVQAGDELPYIPEHQMRVSSGLVASRWAAMLGITFVDRTRTVAGSGPVPDDRATDAFTVVDLAMSLSLTRRLDLFARLDNLFDEIYVVARRPAGSRPGRDRTAMLGLAIEF